MDMKLYQNLMRRIPLFTELNVDEMEQVVRTAKLIRVRPGITVINAGVAGTAMYMVMEGKVRIDRPVPGGGVAMLAEDEAPTVVGEMALIDDGPRTATVTTVTDCVMLQLPKDAFQEMRRQFRPVAYKILRQLASTLSQRLEQKTNRIVGFFEDQYGAR
jgi:CRP/FNR family cyclic AMP-dependent transcriptional regulator